MRARTNLQRLSVRLDELIEFARNPFAAGFHRPLAFTYTKGNIRRNDLKDWIDFPKREIGVHYPPSSFLPGAKNRKTGMIVYPNTGAVAEHMLTPLSKRAYGSAEAMSKSIKRHELIHALRNPEYYSRTSNLKVQHPGKLATLKEEAAVLKRELLGKRAKRTLKTPALYRVAKFIGGLHV